MNYHQRLESMQKSNDLKSDIIQAVENYAALIKDLGQFKCNHENCSAGVDTKKRFYITKKGSTYLGHCFNCGKSGWLFAGAEKASLGLDEIVELGKSPKDITIPFASLSHAFDASNRTYEALPSEMKVWLSLYGLAEEDFSALELRWLGNTLRIPVFTKDKQLVGYVARIFNDTAGSRYKAVVDSTTGKVPWIKLGNPDTIVVTEDILSAYKVWKTTGFTTIALLGTSINDKINAFITSYLPKDPKNIVIWLDKDFAGMSNAGIIGGGLALMFGTFKYSIIEDEEEPKKQSEEDIRRILGEFIGV